MGSVAEIFSSLVPFTGRADVLMQKNEIGKNGIRPPDISVRSRGSLLVRLRPHMLRQPVGLLPHL